jgi:hypothetical protein
MSLGMIASRMDRAAAFLIVQLIRALFITQIEVKKSATDGAIGLGFVK